MDFSIGNVVKSKAGRDKDYFAVVVGFEDDRVLIADGKERPLERPKAKNLIHLQITNIVFAPEQYETNRALRKNINALHSH